MTLSDQLRSRAWEDRQHRDLRERAARRIDELETALGKIAALNDLSGYADQIGAAYGHLAECEQIARAVLVDQ